MAFVPNRTWNCFAHGAFLSDAPHGKCPHGCDSSMVSIVSPPSISLGHTKAVASMVDRKMVDLAAQFGVGDLNIRNGRSAAPDDFRWSESENIRRMRLAGQSYAMPVANNTPISEVIGTAGASSDTNILSEMKEAGNLNMNVHVDSRLSDNTALPEVK